MRFGTTFLTMKNIFVTEGYRGLYSGVSLGMLGSMVAWSSYMFVYSHLKDSLERRGYIISNSFIMLSSISAGICTMFLTNPIWVVKTRLQLQKQTHAASEQYIGVKDAFLKIVRNEGPFAFYKGLVPSTLSTFHGAAQFVTYEATSNFLLRKTESESISSYISFFSGATSKLVAMAVTFPFTLIRSRLQNQRGFTDVKYKGFMDAVHKIFTTEGIFGFYKGIGASTWRLSFSSGIFFLVFEKTKILLKNLDYFTK
eukprot:TRINITY_DN4293_c0_g1_i3.p1 TRINITY_DN4293_c0_g1~~TRINITY_DN4293_c0_g1_i3.p1  ORF type:complete len:255 (-),score=20.39 TRINITY_DN4293_c0_g1_i3:21-785(-)